MYVDTHGRMDVPVDELTHTPKYTLTHILTYTAVYIRTDVHDDGRTPART